MTGVQAPAAAPARGAVSHLGESRREGSRHRTPLAACAPIVGHEAIPITPTIDAPSTSTARHGRDIP
jgi:hypothetical protein